MTSIDPADPALYIILSALPSNTNVDCSSYNCDDASKAKRFASRSSYCVTYKPDLYAHQNHSICQASMPISITARTFSHPKVRTFFVPFYLQSPQFSSLHPQSKFKMPSKDLPGEQFEVRQTSATDDWHPNPSKSLPLSKERQALIDDIIALYSMQPTIERVKRYTPDCGMIYHRHLATLP